MLTYKSKKNIYLLLFFYWFAQVALAFVKISSKGETLDTVLKVAILAAMLIFSFFTVRSVTVYSARNFSLILVWILFSISQIITLLYCQETDLSSIPNYLFPIIALFLFFILLGNETMDKQELFRFLQLYIGVIAFSCIYNIVINFNAIKGIFRVSQAYGNELSSFFDSNHLFGFYCEMGIISCYICKKLNEKFKLLYDCLIVLFLFSIVTTFSRTTAVSLMVFLLFMILQSGSLKKILKAFLLISVLLAIVFSVPRVNDYIINIFFKTSYGLSGRDDIYNLGIQVFLSGNVFVGSGYRESGRIVESVLGHGTYHNAYITILVTGGIIMFTFYFMLIAYCFKLDCELKKRDPFLGKVFTSVLLAYLMFSLTENVALFFTSAQSYIATCFCVLLPMYYLQSLRSDEPSLCVKHYFSSPLAKRSIF